jgi:hypothetical protein
MVCACINLIFYCCPILIKGSGFCSWNVRQSRLELRSVLHTILPTVVFNNSSSIVRKYSAILITYLKFSRRCFFVLHNSQENHKNEHVHTYSFGHAFLQLVDLIWTTAAGNQTGCWQILFTKVVHCYRVNLL